MSVHFSCLYELCPAGWKPAGSGSVEAQRSFLTQRASAAKAGTAALLVSHGECATRSMHPHSGDPGRTPRTTWIGCETFRVASEVAEVLADSRQIKIPVHGYIVVAWRSASAQIYSSRPRLACLDRDGKILTQLNPGEHLHSAI